MQAHPVWPSSVIEDGGARRNRRRRGMQLRAGSNGGNLLGGHVSDRDARHRIQFDLPQIGLCGRPGRGPGRRHRCRLLGRTTASRGTRTSTGRGRTAQQQVISNIAVGAASVFVADLDGDGHADVISGGSRPYDSDVSWYENDGQGNFGEQQVITADVQGTDSVFAADIDGDGRPGRLVGIAHRQQGGLVRKPGRRRDVWRAAIDHRPGGRCDDGVRGRSGWR